LVLALPGGSIIAALIALGLFVQRRRQQSIDADLEALIRPPVLLHGKLSAAESEALQAIAARKRDIAEGKRIDARRIESGGDGAERMRLVVRR
jgi:hypothetical protein